MRTTSIVFVVIVVILAFIIRKDFIKVVKYPKIYLYIEGGDDESLDLDDEGVFFSNYIEEFLKKMLDSDILSYKLSGVNLELFTTYISSLKFVDNSPHGKIKYDLVRRLKKAIKKKQSVKFGFE